MANSTVMYIHGFLSSPESFKAQASKAWLQQHKPEVQFICPSLSSYPSLAREQLLKSIAGLSDVVVIGSSLGGFWASYLVEQKQVKKAVLVNPAVSPHTRFSSYVGQPLKSYYSDELYTLTANDLAVLCAAESTELADPGAYWLLQQKGDEVLDWTMAAKRYQNCACLIEEGGDHSFQGFESHLANIMAFLDV